jgi:hypothetical protein
MITTGYGRMSLDIEEGDTLVVDGVDYPIKACSAWSWTYGRVMRRLLTVTASTKRTPAMTNGKRGAPTTKLTNLKCMPLDPASPEIAQRVALATPHTLLQTVVDGGDVFYELVLENLKR